MEMLKFSPTFDRKFYKGGFIFSLKSLIVFSLSSEPLLSSIEHEDDKTPVISHSSLLHHHDQYKKVFIAPDRTKFEWEKHVKLVNELKEVKII